MAGQKDVSWGPRCHRDPGVRGDELLPACGVSPQWATSSRASTPGRPSRAPLLGVLRGRALLQQQRPCIVGTGPGSVPARFPVRGRTERADCDPTPRPCLDSSGPVGCRHATHSQAERRCPSPAFNVERLSALRSQV